MNTIIKEIIDIAIKSFDIKSLKYQFKESTETHFIEIIPNSELPRNEFAEFAYSAINKMMYSENGGVLSFLSEKSLTKLDSPEYYYFPMIKEITNSNLSNNYILNINSIGNFKFDLDSTIMAGEESWAMAA